MNIDTLYYRSPAALQEVFSNAAGHRIERKRYGDSYIETELEYEARSTWTDRALLAYSRSRRAQALAMASLTPYYAQAFSALGAEWHELIGDETFTQIPPTPKSALRDEPEAFSPRARVGRDEVARTSGTTGASLEILRSRSAVDEQWAVWWRYRGWHGIRRGEPCALFAGRQIMRPDQGAPYWRRNVPGSELRFSTYHISPRTAHLYVKRLNHFGARWIHGYSSAIVNLATCILDQNLTITAPTRWVTLGGENVTPLQMSIIEQAFRVKPIQHYGLAEGAANFSTCTHQRLHVDEDFSGVEFLSEQDSAARVIGTTYANRARILLRYDTGDLASLDQSNKLCGCGFGGRIVTRLDGRGDETLSLPDGRLVGTPEDAFQADMGVAQVQLVQKLDGSIVISYIPSSSWDQFSLSRTESALRRYLGDEISISFREVKELATTRGGKVRLVLKESTANGE